MKKKRFSVVYNDNKEIAFGEGYYIIYEGYDGKPKYDSKYGTFSYSETVDMVSVGILNKINYFYDMNYVYDPYYFTKARLGELF